MGILGKFGNFLEKSGVSVFSKETLKLLTEMFTNHRLRQLTLRYQ